MKKNNVSVDVIAFGDLESDQTKKLEAFVENVKGGDGSNLAIIPPGPHLLSEELQVSPILGGDAAAAGGPEGAEGGAFGFEDAAENDPELAYALRLSLEEEKNRQQKEQKEREEREGKESLDNIPEEAQQGESSGGNGNEKKDDGDKMDTA